MEMDDAVVGSRVDVDYCGSEGICIDVVAISAACVIVAVVTHMHTHIFAHQIIVGRCKLCHICTRTRVHTRTPLWCSRTRKRARTQAHWCAHTHTTTQNRAGLFLNLLDLLAHHHRIVAPDLLGTVFSVIEAALVLVAVSVYSAEQAATSALETCAKKWGGDNG